MMVLTVSVEGCTFAEYVFEGRGSQRRCLFVSESRLFFLGMLGVFLRE